MAVCLLMLSGGRVATTPLATLPQHTSSPWCGKVEHQSDSKKKDSLLTYLSEAQKKHIVESVSGR